MWLTSRLESPIYTTDVKQTSSATTNIRPSEIIASPERPSLVRPTGRFVLGITQSYAPGDCRSEHPTNPYFFTKCPELDFKSTVMISSFECLYHLETKDFNVKLRWKTTGSPFTINKGYNSYWGSSTTIQQNLTIKQAVGVVHFVTYEGFLSPIYYVFWGSHRWVGIQWVRAV
ncbi:hypothetical protein BGX38DRAFT_320630 [Terfezia claveryi]|nr:hypothetical protein BGX38DRAFT_320630 [Terfezia claveryi]